MLVQGFQVPEAELAENDSRFRIVHGVNVHYKAANCADPSRAAAFPAIALYHGFGANTFSWSFVTHKLAKRLTALVVTHDMPGFGLTQRYVSRLQLLVWRLNAMKSETEQKHLGALSVNKEQCISCRHHHARRGV